MPVAPTAREVILEVDQRAEGNTFANQSAIELLKHINVLVNGSPGECTACETINVHITADNDVKVSLNSV